MLRTEVHSLAQQIFMKHLQDQVRIGENLGSLSLVSETLGSLQLEGQRFTQVDIRCQVFQLRSLLGIPSQCQTRTRGIQGQEVLEAEGHLVLVWEMGLQATEKKYYGTIVGSYPEGSGN